MKYIIAASVVLLAACDGESTNPFQQIESVVQGDAVESQPIQPVAQPVVTPVIEQTPVAIPVAPQEPEPAILPPPVEPGPCIDTDPVNDGWGWNGVSSCSLQIVQVQTIESVAPEPEPEPVVETEIETLEYPEIYNPETGEQIDLISPVWESEFLTSRTMYCSVHYFDGSQVVGGPNSVTSWIHNADGTGEVLAFSGTPEAFTWSLQDGRYISERSPLAAEWAELLTAANSKKFWIFWNTQDTRLEHVKCSFN